MSANSLKQAVTSATTSVITLASAVTGFNAFTAADDGIEQNYWVFEGDDFQICSGVYTHSGTTLAITHNLQKSVSGTVTDLPATGLTLTSAAEVIVGGSGLHQTLMFQEGVQNGNHFFAHNQVMNITTGMAGGQFTTSAGRIVIHTAIFHHPVKITEVGVDITTASAGGNIRLGMYHCNSDGSTGDRIYDSGDLSTTSTGLVFATLSSPIILPAGRYYVASAGDNTVVQTVGIGTSAGTQSMTGSAQGISTSSKIEEANYYNQTYGVMPSTLGTRDGANDSNVIGSLFR